MSHTEPETLIQAVHDAYSAKAREGSDPSYSNRVAEAFGYSPEELQSIPVESHMGLSCGNPVATASIKQGETVLDLGSGGGIDIFLAASKIGPDGHAIGLDMSLDMIARARANAARQHLRPPRVAFVHAQLTEPLPLASGTVDCVLSNCALNLLPPAGKAHLLREVYRILRPGGRVVLDDIVARRILPEAVRADLTAHVACIGGAISLEEYRGLLVAAGLQDLVFTDTHGDINVYTTAASALTRATGCCGPAAAGCCGPSTTTSAALTPDFDANEWVASYQIYALKPRTAPSNEPAAPLLRWWDAYPAPRYTNVSALSAEDVATLIRAQDRASVVVVDVRRGDHAGGHIRGSVQRPAQTFFDDLPGFYAEFGHVEKVIFYCGSSRGRGPRCAAWYQDYVAEKGATVSQAYVLEGGIVAWLEKFGKDMELVDRDPEEQ